jgi:hypothetical protein
MAFSIRDFIQRVKDEDYRTIIRLAEREYAIADADSMLAII